LINQLKYHTKQNTEAWGLVNEEAGPAVLHNESNDIYGSDSNILLLVNRNKVKRRRTVAASTCWRCYALSRNPRVASSKECLALKTEAL